MSKDINNILSLKQVKLSRDKISIYRDLVEDKVIDLFYELISLIESKTMDISEFINKYNDFYFALSKSGKSCFREYIIENIIFDENIYSLNMDEEIMDIVKNDLNNLMNISDFTSENLKKHAVDYFKDSEVELDDVESLPEWKNNCNDLKTDYPEHIKSLIDEFMKSSDWSKCAVELLSFHKRFGTGKFARYKAFTWEEIKNEKILRGIASPDPIELKDLIGYEVKRETIIENTLQFLNGFPANNMLLYGDRGTGKSSTVKALLNKYYTEGLRIIEIPKEYLSDFPEIIRDLRSRPQKFIIFIDDLTFEDGETGYTALKAVLEGSVEAKPENVLIYATSNRRHLVKEYFHERKGLGSSDPNEEVHASDSIQEKLSLADRFGITVVFSSPTQDEYLEIIEGLVKNRNIQIESEELERRALEWERSHNGRSARTARQFVDYLEGNLGIKG